MLPTVTLEWAGRELCTHLLAGRGLARSITPGDSVTLSVRPEDIHLIPRSRPDRLPQAAGRCRCNRAWARSIIGGP